MSTIVAIDGPAASGKSTVARRVAAALGALYVDSGSLYRTVTLKVLQRGVNPAESAAVVALLPEVRLEFFVADGAVRIRLDGEEPGERIRAREVNEGVSPVAATAEVRRLVTGLLRGLASFGDLVMEGRDIGTAVFPDAAYKFYLDADPAERARRRHQEIAGMTVQEVGANITKRDRIDSGRATAPLMVAPGAAVVDTTGLGIDQVVAAVLERVRPSPR